MYEPVRVEEYQSQVSKGHSSIYGGMPADMVLGESGDRVVDIQSEADVAAIFLDIC